MPEILLGDRVPGPVGSFGVGENDSRVFVFLFGVAPDVEVAFRRAAWSLTGRLKPRMLIGGVIHHQLDHHLQVAVVSAVQEGAEIVDGAVHRMDIQIVGDVVAVVLERRGKEGQQPEAGDAQILKIIHFLNQARENRRCRRRCCP